LNLENDSFSSFMQFVGWAHYKQGQYYVAALEFQQAISKSPTTSQYHYHLALALLAQGENKEAEKSLRKALSGKDNFTERSEAEQLLQKMKTM
jgi:tetratricopeptide (TPR) repeat protein